MKNIPVYELRIDEATESFVSDIALVDCPAIESDFIAFEKQQENITFSMDEERMELLGAAMIPDINIYRVDKNGNEYYAFFTADTVRTIAQVFSKNGFQKNINLQHSAINANSFVFQSYIVDSKKGMTSPNGLNLKDGTWVVGLKVTDKQVWKDIKAGKLKGFSVEGVFQLFKEDFNTYSNIKEVEEILQLIEKLENYTKK